MESSTCGHLISRPHSRVIVISSENLPECIFNMYHYIIKQIGPILFKKNRGENLHRILQDKSGQGIRLAEPAANIADLKIITKKKNEKRRQSSLCPPQISSPLSSNNPKQEGGMCISIRIQGDSDALTEIRNYNLTRRGKYFLIY